MTVDDWFYRTAATRTAQLSFMEKRKRRRWETKVK